MEAPSTFSCQTSLPRLPIPSLNDTCSLYLQSLKPLQTADAYAKTKAVVQDFVQSSLAASLQQRLIDLERVSPFNWLEDNFWLRKAYLEWRTPLMIHSNWFILGQDDPHNPLSLASSPSEDTSSSFSAFQIRRAAHLIYQLIDVKEAIDSETLPVEKLKNGSPLCMWQYSRIFGVTRVPQARCDGLVQQKDTQSCRHMIVLACDQVYCLYVYEHEGTIWRRRTRDELERALLAIVHHALSLTSPQQPIPLLTSWGRDEWATARNHLLTLSPENREHMTMIEDAIAVLALDDGTIKSDPTSRARTTLVGHERRGAGHNRWFDKALTLIVESTGQCAFSGEHSPVDALIVSYVYDMILRDPVPFKGPHPTTFIKPSPPVDKVHHVEWITDSSINDILVKAQAAADDNAAQSDVTVLIFEDFGSQWIKQTGRVPPDAFLQMAIQLTYYRLHGHVTPTYETASTRQFLHGRTETIRVCSADSTRFVHQFDSSTVNVDEKYRLLVKATEAHQVYTRKASNGQGCDRHLLALRVLNADHILPDGQPAPMHPMFADPIFTKSQTWRLSTSTLQSGIQLTGTGFGSVCRDGYGINYMVAPTLIKFGIETKHVTETVSSASFSEALGQALRDMRALCEEVTFTKDVSKL